MRVLFTFAGGSGHADPLIPIAVAVRDAGHTVAFSGRGSAAGTIEAAGLELLGGAGPGAPADVEIAPLRPLDMGHEERVLRAFYAGTEARLRAAQMHDRIDAWRPDLIVCDEVDFGSMIAAEKCGLPHATVLVTATGAFVRPEIVVEALDVVRAEHGLRPDPNLAMPGRHLVISPFPPSFRDPAYPLPPSARSIRPASVSPSADRPERGGPTGHERPTVYLTLGTVFNAECGDLFERAIQGLGALPVNVVVTVGRDRDPVRFGPQPSNVRIDRYIPLPELLPSCNVVVCHGGSGSVIGALAHGLPLLVLPMGADQALNAARCEQLDVGLTLDAATATAGSIGEAAAELLSDATYRNAAGSLSEEIARLPDATSTVSLLEQLV